MKTTYEMLMLMGVSTFGITNCNIVKTSNIFVVHWIWVTFGNIQQKFNYYQGAVLSFIIFLYAIADLSILYTTENVIVPILALMTLNCLIKWTGDSFTLSELSYFSTNWSVLTYMMIYGKADSIIYYISCSFAMSF